MVFVAILLEGFLVQSLERHTGRGKWGGREDRPGLRLRLRLQCGFDYRFRSQVYGAAIQFYEPYPEECLSTVCMTPPAWDPLDPTAEPEGTHLSPSPPMPNTQTSH
ncbi:unnamed protein product [Coregonus sp. 'balchen']|nr:unnamed protein product [Coregonus sp. 'balchen']